MGRFGEFLFGAKTPNEKTPTKKPIKPSQEAVASNGPRAGGAKNDASGTNASVNPQQGDDAVKEKFTPSFEDFPRYFKEIFRKKFQDQGIYCEDLIADISEKIKPSGEWHERAGRMYEVIISNLQNKDEKDNIEMKIKGIQWSGETSEKQNSLLHELYTKEIFQPIFNELIREIPKEERMSQDELRERIKAWKTRLPSFSKGSLVESSYREMWEIYSKAEHYKKRYPIFRKDLEDIMESLDKSSGNYIKGKKEMHGINNPEEIKKKIIENYEKIIEIGPKQKGEPYPELDLLKDYNERLNKLNVKDDSISEKVDEALFIAGVAD